LFIEKHRESSENEWKSEGKIMKINGRLWKNLQEHGENLWKSLTYGRSMEPRENSWAPWDLGKTCGKHDYMEQPVEAMICFDVFGQFEKRMRMFSPVF
jgi:hypothetical protein